MENDNVSFFAIKYKSLEDLILSGENLHSINKIPVKNSPEGTQLYVYYYYVSESSLFGVKYVVLDQNLKGWITFKGNKIAMSNQFVTHSIRIAEVERDTLLTKIFTELYGESKNE